MDIVTSSVWLRSIKKDLREALETESLPGLFRGLVVPGCRCQSSRMFFDRIISTSWDIATAYFTPFHTLWS